MATRAPFSGGGEKSTEQPAEPTATEVRKTGIYTVYSSGPPSYFLQTVRHVCGI